MSQDATNPPATNSTEMVKVTQLPVIEDQLRAIKTWVAETVANVDAMVCNEETLLEVKSFRTDLNHLFAELEIRRKDVLKEVEEPINQFKATYKECVSDYFKRADTILKEKISAVESEMKGACETRLRAYFDELTHVNGLGFLKYEQAGIVVSMADARAKTQPPKKLREQLERFVARVGQDVDMILTLKNASEILAVYKLSLNATEAIRAVNERHRQIEQAQAEQERRSAVKAQEEEARQKVEAFAPPTVSETEKVEDLLSCTFTITDTLDRLRLLKQFLDANGYKYTN
jgi:hypothetical protein